MEPTSNRTGSGKKCKSRLVGKEGDWCKICSRKGKKGVCEFKDRWAAPALAKAEVAFQDRPTRVGVARDIKAEYSPSKKLCKSEVKHMRRDPSRTAHGQDRLAALLLSKEATPGESQ